MAVENELMWLNMTPPTGCMLQLQQTQSTWTGPEI